MPQQPDIESLILGLRSNLTRFRNTVDAGSLDDARFSIRALAEYAIGLKRHETNAPSLVPILESAMQIWASGVNAQPIQADDLRTAEERLMQSWPYFLSATLLAPAWRFARVPTLEQVPIWLWGHYARWILAPTTGAAGSSVAEANVLHVGSFLEELAGWAERNIGSGGVRDAIGEVVRFHPGGSLRQSSVDTARSARALGRIVARIAPGEIPRGYTFPPRDAARERIKVGFIFPSLVSTVQTRAALTFFQHLDQSQFEVIAFAAGFEDADFEQECRTSGVAIEKLRPGLADCTDGLREAELDIAVFIADLPLHADEWAQLALHRIARIQLVLPSISGTTGLPAIDVRVVGKSGFENSSERIAQLNWPNIHLDTLSMPRPDENALALLRTAVGLPEGAHAVVARADIGDVSPQTLDLWGEILTRAEGTHLIWSLPMTANRAKAQFVVRSLCLAHRIKAERILLHFDAKPLAIALASAYLDPTPCSSLEGVSAALTLGIPSVAMSAGPLRSKVAANILEAAGLSQCVAKSSEQYVDLALSFLKNPSHAISVGETALQATSLNPALTDTLARSEAFGALLKTLQALHIGQGTAAFDPKLGAITAPQSNEAPNVLLERALQQLESGRIDESLAISQAVLAQRPDLAVARHIHGKILMAKGNSARAVHYFLGALQGDEQSADLWWELAIAFRQSGSPSQAIDSLSACLRLEGDRIEAWELLSELAREAGHEALIDETRSVLQSLRGEVGSPASS